MGYIHNVTHCNINMDAFRILNLNGNQYMYLDIVNQYQNIPTAMGWATPGIGNNLYSKTGLKYHIGRLLNFSDNGTEKLYKTLLKRGLIRESPCGQKFAVTMEFFVLKQTGKTLVTHEKERKEKENTLAPKVPVIPKLQYAETDLYASLDRFRETVNEQVANLPANVDYSHYYNEFRRVYTTENLTPLTVAGWHAKVKRWITEDRQAGKLKLIAPAPAATATPTVETDEAIIEKLRGLYAKTRQVDPFFEFSFSVNDDLKKYGRLFSDYEATVRQYIACGEQAKKRKILPPIAEKDIAVFDAAVKKSELTALLKSFVSERKTRANSS